MRIRTGWAAAGAPLLVSRTRPETDAERRNGNRHMQRTFPEARQINPQDPFRSNVHAMAGSDRTELVAAQRALAV
jgi:hypothetical protein